MRKSQPHFPRRARSLFIEPLENRALMATITVDSPLDLVANDGVTTLREAITQANGNGETDTINFSASLANQTITLTSGRLNITSDVTITGLGANSLSISGNNASQIFFIDGIAGAKTVTIQDLTLTQGRASGGGPASAGGIILDTASFGGALLSLESALTLKRLAFTNNVLDFVPPPNAGSVGGGALTVNADNSLGVTIADCTFSGNEATGNSVGGAILTFGNQDRPVRVTNSTFSDNQADFGGAITVNGDTVVLTNSTVTGNRGISGGAGLDLFRGSLTVHNSIVAGNVRTGNSAPEDLTAGSIIDATSSNNIIGDAANAGGLTNGVNGNIVGVAVASVLDPTLAINGGPTMTHALAVNSPAINAGSMAFFPTYVTNVTPISAAVAVQGGKLQLTNRGHLSTGNLDPTDAGLRITGKWTFDDTGTDFLQILTRSDGVPNPDSFDETSNGLEFQANGDDETLRIIGRGVINNVTGGGPVAFPGGLQPSGTYLFDITDDGTNVTFTLTDANNSANTATVTASSNIGLLTNRVTLHNRESNGGTLGNHVALVDDLLIRNTAGKILLSDNFEARLDQRGTGFSRIVSGVVDIGAYEAQGPRLQLAPIENLAVPAQPLGFDFFAIFDSPPIVPGNVTLVVNWGDNSPAETISGPAGTLSANHTFTTAGNFRVTASATDASGVTGKPLSFVMQVRSTQVIRGALFVGGSTVRDVITITPASNDGKRVGVKIGTAAVKNFTPTKIVVFGGGGNDAITVASVRAGTRTIKPNVPIRIFGGSGSDTINASASAANTIIVGGTGNDRIIGSATARDILIGGLGRDNLLGGGNDDILIAGRTTRDNFLAALDRLMAVWNGKGTYAARRNALLRGTAARPRLDRTTVFNDAVPDSLDGQLGNDWFFATLTGSATTRDVVRNKARTETLTAQQPRP